MKNLFRRAAAAVMGAMMLLGSAGALSSLAYPVPAAAEETALTYAGTRIAPHEGGCDYLDRTLTTHIFDFSVDSISYYAADHTAAYNGTPIITDGRCTNREGRTFTFGSALCVGDRYGLEKGFASFTLCMNGGKVSFGVRNTVTASTPDKRGLWFEFTPGTLTVRETDSGISCEVPVTVDLSEGKTVRFAENLSELVLTVDGQTLVTADYVRGGRLAIRGADGAVLAETEKTDMEPTGYFSIHLEGLDGWIDDVIYTNVTETPRETADAQELRLIDYSTWTATDDLGRTLSDNAAVGDPKDNRDVGIFYFLCWVGAGSTIVDNTKMYATGGMDAINDFYKDRAGEAYWGEPFFGYYRNTDTWVYRKHAYMLEAAGIDFVFLDVSNSEVFIEGHMALFNTWLEMRREGIDTPQIVFFFGDTASTFDGKFNKVMSTVYSDENWDKYKELFYCWDGKPLMFGNVSGLSADSKAVAQEKFTLRGNWAWCDKNGYWSWMQEYNVKGEKVQLKNGGWGRDAEGNYESLAVCLGHHATSSNGRSFVNSKQPNNKKNDFEFSSIERAGQGLCFANEWLAVQTLMKKSVPEDQPFCLLITGWNEWIAGGQKLDHKQSFCNGQADILFVDNFNAEFSRDAEPMRNVNGYGFGDNYYYQLIDIVRQYKGVAAAPEADHQGTVSIYDLSDWDGIGLTYRDSLRDVEHRNTISYDANLRYINNTGRNDLDEAKVSQDDYNLYFLINCADDIIVDNGSNWMNLFVNADNDPATGWNGFDYVINRDRDAFAASVERITAGEDGKLTLDTVGGAYYAVQGRTMTVRVSKDLLGLKGLTGAFTFKWADNSVLLTSDDPAAVVADPMGFMDLGDTAPDNRCAFIYKCSSCTTTEEKPVTLVTSEGDYPVRQTNALPEIPDYTLSFGSRSVDYLFDAEKESAGIYVTDSALAEYFQHTGGTSTSKVQILKDKTTGNKYLKMTGYSDLRTWNDVKGSYELSVDLHMIDTGNSAVYVRGEMPGAHAPINPRNHSINQVFNYYEWDWYAENGGHQFGGSSTAGSGIGIYPTEDSLIVRIKRYAPDGLHVASASHTFKYPASYEVGGDGWFNLHVIDDGTTVSILCSDTLLCTIRMEGAGVTYETDGTGQEYYARAFMYDADGTEVLAVENTRLNSVGSQVAVTTRNQTMEFDNVYITYTELLVEGNHVSADWNGTPGTTHEAPDTRLMTTLFFGSKPEPQDDPDTEPDTTPVTDPETEPTDTQPEETTGGGASTDPESDTSAGNEKGGCKSASLFVLPLFAAAAVLFVRRRED